MNSLLNLKYLEELDNNGITKVQNFLSSEELEKIKNINSGHCNKNYPKKKFKKHTIDIHNHFALRFNIF